MSMNPSATPLVKFGVPGVRARGGALYGTTVEPKGITDWSVPMKKLYRVVISKGAFPEGGLIGDTEAKDEPARQFFVEGATVLDVLRRLAMMTQLADQQRVEITRAGEMLAEPEE